MHRDIFRMQTSIREQFLKIDVNYYSEKKHRYLMQIFDKVLDMPLRHYHSITQILHMGSNLEQEMLR